MKEIINNLKKKKRLKKKKNIIQGISLYTLIVYINE